MYIFIMYYSFICNLYYNRYRCICIFVVKMLCIKNWFAVYIKIHSQWPNCQFWAERKKVRKKKNEKKKERKKRRKEEKKKRKKGEEKEKKTKKKHEKKKPPVNSLWGPHIWEKVRILSKRSVKTVIIWYLEISNFAYSLISP